MTFHIGERPPLRPARSQALRCEEAKTGGTRCRRRAVCGWVHVETREQRGTCYQHGARYVVPTSPWATDRAFTTQLQGGEAVSR